MLSLGKKSMHRLMVSLLLFETQNGRHYGWSVRSSSMIGTQRAGDAAKMPFEKERNIIPSLKLTDVP